LNLFLNAAVFLCKAVIPPLLPGMEFPHFNKVCYKYEQGTKPVPCSLNNTKTKISGVIPYVGCDLLK